MQGEASGDSPFVAYGPCREVWPLALYMTTGLRMQITARGSDLLCRLTDHAGVTELARWDRKTGAWVTVEGGGGGSADDAELGTRWLPGSASTVDDLTDRQLAQLISGMTPVWRCLLDLLAAGWTVSTRLTVDAGTDRPRLSVQAEPPDDVDQVAARAAAASAGIGFGTVGLEWHGPRRREWGGTWILDHVTTAGTTAPVDAATLYAIFVIGSTSAPAWTLPHGFDRPISRHSEDQPMPVSAVAAAVGVATARDAEVVAGLRRKAEAWADGLGFHQVGSTRPGTAGYYLLGFDDGDAYLGASTDLADRLVARRHEQRGVTWVRTLPDAAVPAVQMRFLLDRERELIGSLREAGVPLRTRAAMSFRGGHSDVDDVFTTIGQTVDAWLADPVAGNGVAADRRWHPTRAAEADGRARLSRFREHAGDAADRILDLQRAYVHRCVPLPSLTEHTWWIVATPRAAADSGTVTTITTGVVAGLRIDGDLSSTLEVNVVDLLGEDPSEADLIRFRRQHPGTDVSPVPYRGGGEFTAVVRAANLDVLADLLDDTAVTRAAATAALNGMRAASVGKERDAHNPVLAALLMASG